MSKDITLDDAILAASRVKHDVDQVHAKLVALRNRPQTDADLRAQNEALREAQFAACDMLGAETDESGGAIVGMAEGAVYLIKQLQKENRRLTSESAEREAELERLRIIDKRYRSQL